MPPDPGDPITNPAAPLQTLNLVRKRFPRKQVILQSELLLLTLEGFNKSAQGQRSATLGHGAYPMIVP
jgi:hypothetical protein